MSVSELLVDEICLPLLTILLSRLTYLSVIYILCYRPKHYHRELHVSFSALISIHLQNITISNEIPINFRYL